MAAALLIMTLASGIAQMGLANSLVFHIGKSNTPPTRKIFILTAAAVALMTIPLSSIGMTYIYPDTYYISTLLIIFGSIATALFTFASTTLQIRPDLKEFNLAKTVPALTATVFLTLLWLTGRGISFTELLYFQIVVLFLLALYLLQRLWRRMPLANESANSKQSFSTKSLANYAAKYHGTILLSLLIINIDKLFLINNVNASQFGIYTLAFSITRVIGSVQDAASLTTFVKYAGKDSAALAAAVNLSFRLSFVPMLGVAAIISLASPFFIPAVFGQAYSGMITSFILLTFEVVIGAASWTLAQRFNAGGRPGTILFRQLVIALPLLTAINFLPADNTANWMAALMFASSLLRLVITVAMISILLKEPFPTILPSAAELKELIHRLRKS